MISSEEIEKHVSSLFDMFGDLLPDPTHEPKKFQHCLKLYYYYTLKSAQKSDINTNG